MTGSGNCKSPTLFVPRPCLSESTAIITLSPYQCLYIPCEVVYLLPDTALQRILLLNTDIAPGLNIQNKIFMITVSQSCFSACDACNKMRISAFSFVELLKLISSF